ncbi:FAD-dependent oxidoreductase [Candidatus Woesearchaeota archaeon]|nr:FAD-dependent oxidoreductase [Candidatus Woesearchaeota archaeon]
MSKEKYDLIIIGAGAAAYSAAIYAQRAKLSVLIIGKLIGGTTTEAHLIENWPGTKSKPGLELMNEFKAHTESYGAKILMDEVVRINKKDDDFLVHTKSKEEYQSSYILLAIGLDRRKLGIPGEKELLGRGVSYCATCDAFFFKDKTVAVVGGSDAATMTAILLSEHAKKVYIVYRRDKLRGEPVWIERVQENPKIELILNTTLTKINGEKAVESVSLDKGENLAVEGVFIEVGSVPSKVLINALGVEVDKEDYIVVDETQKTNVDGVYAAGDITNASNKLKQVVTSASEGAIAANNIFKKNAVRVAKK